MTCLRQNNYIVSDSVWHGWNKFIIIRDLLLFRLVTHNIRSAPRNNTRPDLICPLYKWYLNKHNINSQSYADDTKVYCMINEPDKDISALQLDLNIWSNLHLSPKKCEVMCAMHSRDKSKPIYSLGVQLKSLESVKDLGVTINYDLSWGKHVSYIVNKAKKVLGVIKQSLGNENRHAFSCLYKSSVRPILEYAVPVWSPYQIKDIESLEKVQTRASQLTLKQKLG